MSSRSSKHKRDQAVASLKKRQEDLDQLVAMFGSSIPPSTVERIFSANNCDVDQSIEALLAAASVDAEEIATSKIDTPEVTGKDWVVAGSGRIGKPRENTQIPAQNSQARIASNSRSEKASQNKFSVLSHPSSFRSVEDNSSVSKNDYDAFVRWKAPLEEFLSQEDLSDIWNQVRKEYWSEQKDLKRKVEIANIYAQQRIDFLLESNESSLSPMSQSDKSPFSDESSKNTKIDESDYVLSFKRLFADIISNEQLEEMWRSIRLVDIDLEQKEELAVLYVMEYLEEKEQDNAETMSLLEVLSVQEAQRLERKQELDLKTHLKRENKQSTQDAALQCVLQVFEDTTMKDDITPQEVSKMLIACQYDVEETVARLCQATLQRGSFVRHDATFSDVAAVRNESRKSRQGPQGSSKITNSKRILTEEEQPSMKYSQVVKTHRANGNNFTSSNVSSSSSNKLNPLFRSRMRKDPSYNFRFGVHFLGVLRAKNPLVITNLSEDGEILFKGMKPHHSQRCDGHRNMLFIIIDLHGLPVVQALQVVDSSIDFYRDSFYSTKSPQLVDCVTIRFIVGKGLHSPGGIAKIGPAVQRLLKDRGERDFVPYEGVVVVCIKK